MTLGDLKTGGQSRRVRNYSTVLAAAFSLILVMAVFMTSREYSEEAERICRFQANAIFHKDLAVRKWASEHDVIYVPVTPTTQSNPYLADHPERDVRTAAGRQLTLLNPAHIMREINAYPESLEAGGRSHLAGIRPINPTNTPDSWERTAIDRLIAGESSVGEVTGAGESAHYRLIHPLRLEQGCVKCHRQEGFKVGEIMGGLSVSVPMSKAYEIVADEMKTSIIAQIVIWLAVMGMLYIGAKRLQVAADSLEQAENSYRSLFEQAAVGVARVETATGKVLAINGKYCGIVGYSPEELSKITLRGLTHPDDVQLDIVNRQKLMHEGASELSFDKRYVNRDGNIVWVNLTLSPERSENGIPCSHIVIAQDISEKKRLEEENRAIEAQMLHVQKLESLGVLAGGIAHDFNNILTVVIGHAELAATQLPADSPINDNLVQITAAATRASGLADQMLAYSGKGQFIVSSIDLNSIVLGMGQMIDVSTAKRARISYQLAENLPSFTADAVQMNQVVMNLVMNAAEAIDSNEGVITITTGLLACSREFLGNTWLNDNLPEGSYLFLEVTDNGCGIDPEVLPRIFEPFYTTKFTGRGLGMAALLGIIRSHKGAISVKSDPDRGSSFTVFLPPSAVPV